VNATKALKEYFAQEPHAGEKLSAKELLAFKKALSDAEYQELGKQACEALGETYDPPEPK
jgi:hypothetical protein